MVDGAPDTFDIVVLGGGSGGYACAIRAAECGLSVALVEQDKLGGTCLHQGCIPTKALLHAGEVADTVRHSAAMGVRADLTGIDMDAMHAYKDAVVTRLHKGLNGLIKGHGITVVVGSGVLHDPHTVAVGERLLVGRHIVLATGSTPRSLPTVPIGGPIMTSEQALQHRTLPAQVVVLGGGVIGVEFASIYRSLGAQVTVLEADSRLVPAEDPTISTALERAFRKRGITVTTGVRVASAEPETDRPGVTISLASGEHLRSDLLLVAVGRGPVTQHLGFEEGGVVLDRGFVVTDERLRTSVPHIRAVGDIVVGAQLAHRGFAQGIFVAEDIAGLAPTPPLETGIPRVTYCDPEISSVGLTEAAARERYGDVATYEYNLGGNGKSGILGTSGLVKVVRRAGAEIVGIHMIGARLGEQSGEAALIVNWGALPEEVAALIHAHPTQNEALGEAHLALAGKPLHAHS